jgi:hypothetical protein
MKNLFQNNRSEIIFFAIVPVLILLEGLFVNPVGQFQAFEPTIPFLQLIAILFFRLFLYKNTNCNFNIITTTILLILLWGIFIANTSISIKLSFIIVLLFALLLGTHKKSTIERYNLLAILTYAITLISILIYIQRMIMYDFNIFRVRVGINIWGGNSIIMLYFFLISIGFIIGKSTNHLIILNIIAMILSVLFVTRVTIILTALLLLFQLLFLTRKYFLWIISLTGLILVFKSAFLNSIFYDAIFRRFDSSIASFQYSSNFSDFIGRTGHDRSTMWELAQKLANENFFGVGIGGFKIIAEYSNAHNLFLNNIAELGYFLGILMNIIILIPFYIIIIIKVPIKHKVMSSVSYLFFLINATISGAGLIQTSGFVSSLNLIFLSAFISMISIKNGIIRIN